MMLTPWQGEEFFFPMGDPNSSEFSLEKYGISPAEPLKIRFSPIYRFKLLFKNRMLISQFIDDDVSGI
jgi:hypothetical protein